MSSIKSIDPSSIPQAWLHGYLLAAIAPRPIAWASTIDKTGNVNLSPFSFFNVFSSNPPIMIFSPARRGRDNTTKHTFENVLEVPEVVINIVNFPLVEQMSLSSTEYKKEVNEFTKAGLTQTPSDKIQPPRVGEAPVAFECKVDQVIELGDSGGAGNLILSRVVMIHIQEQFLNDKGALDTTKLDLVGRMGESWYCRANGDALFEIPKPIKTKGIGIDQLPDSIKNSSVLTGNNLGRLGNVEVLPSKEEIQTIKDIPGMSSILNLSSREELHRLAQKYLEIKETELALKILMI